jgi:aspartyl protease family protein
MTAGSRPMDHDLPRGLKLVTVWLLLGAAVFVAVQWWQAREREARFQLVGEAVEIRRGADGQYHWPGELNGRAVDFLVDTGATSTAIPTGLARELGLVSLGSVDSSTAGGVVTGEIVRADLALRGGIRVERLRVVALPGLGEHPLLGMDVLGRLHWQQRDAVLRIEPGEAP